MFARVGELQRVAGLNLRDRDGQRVVAGGEFALVVGSDVVVVGIPLGHQISGGVINGEPIDEHPFAQRIERNRERGEAIDALLADDLDLAIGRRTTPLALAVLVADDAVVFVSAKGSRGAVVGGNLCEAAGDFGWQRHGVDRRLDDRVVALAQHR